jgi:hypothetical protein
MSEKSTDSKAEIPARKPYVQPVLREWGTLIDLTQVGNTHPGGDCHGGSVTWANPNCNRP